MPAAPSIRARVRAQLTDEIKATARRHLATDGANLSLRAVARDMGMVSSAVYRYFASRDQLLTALILDAYGALGAAVEAGDAAVADRADVRARWLGCCHAARAWALANPAEYALIFGSPVPGYQAPQDTVTAATRTPTALIRIAIDGYASGALTGTGPKLPKGLRPDLTRLRESFAPQVPETTLARGMLGWIHLFGAINFELFGQLTNVIEEKEAFFDYQVRQIGQLIGFWPAR